MVIEIIAKYLETNKRLVVPNLGTFIVKVPMQSVLFSNLIKNDDGVLRSLLHQSGISELDAAALIDKFVFEVNYRLENSQVCALDGFGVLRSGANGTVAFSYNTEAKGDVLDGGASERMAEIEAQRAAEVEQQEPKIEIVEQTKVEEPEQDAGDDEGEVVINVAPRRVAEPMPVERRKSERRRNDADYVKGLRYGKGRKVVTGREGATSRKSSKGSAIMIIAMIAALVAILALAYGFWNDWRNQRYMYEGLYEESVYDGASTAEQGVRNPDLDYITPNQN